MRRKILVTASAMMLAAQLGSPVAAAEPTSEQLEPSSPPTSRPTTSSGLRAYLDTYPSSREGDTALAALLRRFLVESAVGNDYSASARTLRLARHDRVQTAGGPPGPARY